MRKRNFSRQDLEEERHRARKMRDEEKQVYAVHRHRELLEKNGCILDRDINIVESTNIQWIVDGVVIYGMLVVSLAMFLEFIVPIVNIPSIGNVSLQIMMGLLIIGLALAYVFEVITSKLRYGIAREIAISLYRKMMSWHKTKE